MMMDKCRFCGRITLVGESHEIRCREKYYFGIALDRLWYKTLKGELYSLRPGGYGLELEGEEALITLTFRHELITNIPGFQNDVTHN